MAIAVSGRGYTPTFPEQPGTEPSTEVDPARGTSQAALTELGDKLAKSRGYRWDERQKSLDARSGFPQRFYLKPGRIVVVEYVESGKKLSKAQSEWEAILEVVEREANDRVVYIVVSPESWVLLREALI